MTQQRFDRLAQIFFWLKIMKSGICAWTLLFESWNERGLYINYQWNAQSSVCWGEELHVYLFFLVQQLILLLQNLLIEVWVKQEAAALSLHQRGAEVSGAQPEMIRRERQLEGETRRRISDRHGNRETRGGEEYNHRRGFSCSGVMSEGHSKYVIQHIM